MKKFFIFILTVTCITTFSAAQSADYTLFREEGIASWYGNDYAGRLTASGEIFDPSQFTAAHRTLPFGTMITVTNMQNMRQVTVRINDRGPFTQTRIIDLSQAAAQEIDLVLAGTTQVVIMEIMPPQPVRVPAEIARVPGAVQVQIGEPAPPQPQVQPMTQPPQTIPTPAAFFPAPPARIVGGIPDADHTGLFRLQVGAYSIQNNAIEAFLKLRSAGLDPRYEQAGEFIRVVLSGLNARDIPAIAQSLGNAGFPEAIIRQEN